MKLLLAFVFLTLTSFTGICQTFSYRFEGILTQENSDKISQEISAIPMVSDVKFLLKEDKGELIFKLSETGSPSKEESNPNPIKNIKDILIAFNLSPLELKEREN